MVDFPYTLLVGLLEVANLRRIVLRLDDSDRSVFAKASARSVDNNFVSCPIGTAIAMGRGKVAGCGLPGPSR
jgi:hypothetical protein